MERYKWPHPMFLSPGNDLRHQLITDREVQIPPNRLVDLTGADLRRARIKSRALLIRGIFDHCQLKHCEIIVDFVVPSSGSATLVLEDCYVIRSQGAVLVNDQTRVSRLPMKVQETLAVLSTLPNPGELERFGAKLADGIYIVEMLRRRK